MRIPHLPFRETHIIGTDTPEQMVGADVSPYMQLLGNMGLNGVSDAGRDFCIVRLNPGFGQILACHQGYGQVWVNGRWARCAAGMAYLTPPEAPHAYHTVVDSRWGFSWLLWWPPRPGDRPLIDCAQPMLVHVDGRYFHSAIVGLHREAHGAADSRVLDKWVELLHAYSVRLGQAAGLKPARTLDALWDRVDSKLSYPWTLRELADLAALSEEHLRRLCQQQSGRSPMHHVAFLRMTRAAVLLESTEQKVAAVGRSVGYPNAAAFTTAFKRHHGVPPEAYRQRRRRARRRNFLIAPR